MRLPSLARTLTSSLACLLLAFPAHAATMLDEEFTQACITLTSQLRPNLAPGTQVRFALIANPEINAFVTGENVVYIHSGLIDQAPNATALQGVLAHELGHVAAHHILQSYDNAKGASIGAVAGMVLGLGAAVAGAGQAGTAIAMGSQAGAIQSMLSHTRTQEAEADRHAINALHASGLSAQGMVDMFTKLRTESQLSYDAPPPWLVTHPLPPERLANLQQIIQTESPALKTGLLKVNQEIDYPRLQAKVDALTLSPGATLRKYTGADDASQYARAIAYMQQGQMELSQSTLAPLIKKHPDDPYYQEILGQMALGKSDLPTANAIFSKLVKQKPNALIFREEYADTLRAQANWAEARGQYEYVTRAWPEWSEPWQGLSLTYGNLGRIPESHLAMAESRLGAADIPGAEDSLKIARNYLKKTPNPTVQPWADELKSRIEELK